MPFAYETKCLAFNGTSAQMGYIVPIITVKMLIGPIIRIKLKILGYTRWK